MNKGLFRKGFVLGIICLFVGAGVIPSTVGIKKERTTIQTICSRGYIQDLIDNASDGDTIYIPSGTYYENIVIDKSINLVGEDKNTTIIDGSGTAGTVVVISADGVNISGFTIQNGSKSGINLGSSHNTIEGNSILRNEKGIILHWMYKYYNKITGNTVSYNQYGIYLDGSCYNNITGNTFSFNINGIYFGYNIFWQHYFNSYDNTILKNNFLQNKRHAFFVHAPLGGNFFNTWQENYWNRPRIFPKPIFGRIIILPWINFDYRPAKEPYDI